MEKKYLFIVGGNKLKICDFTLPEIEIFLAECNFTYEELVLFNLRAKDIPLEKCAENMNMSIATVNRINKRIKAKVVKVNEMCQNRPSERVREYQH